MLACVAAEAATAAGLPAGAMSLIAGGGREELAELATQTGVVDLIIPRGGEGLKAALKGVATVPVIYAASGNNHVFVDASADLESAQAIIMNSKLQRPGTCNAAEKLLVHADVADAFCPARSGRSAMPGSPSTATSAPAAPPGSRSTPPATGLGHRVPRAGARGGVVDSAARRSPHINAHGSGHSEAIVTRDTVRLAPSSSALTPRAST